MSKFQVVTGVRPRYKNTTPVADGFKRPRAYTSNPEVIDKLKELADKHRGLLKPQLVLAEAVSEDSPLHKIFDWDDTQAAEKYRLIQARAVLTVAIEYISMGSKVRPQKVFVSLSSDRQKEGGGYRTLVSVMGDREKRQQLIQDALEEMSHFEERYKSLKEMHRVIEAMRDTNKITKIG